MSRRIPFLCVALILPIILSGPHEVLAQRFARYGRGYGGYGFFDTGIGAFGGGTYPGQAFGYSPAYLASRAFTAGGVAGSVTYGTPQPPEPQAPPSTALARAATATFCSQEKVLCGETAFRAGDYPAAIEDWNSVLACDSCNPVLVMMLAQAYFAAGDYRGAAAATQAAMQELPQDRWGVVVSNRNELYCNPKSYSFQLQQLENAVNDHPNDPAQRFLLAFQYAYLGYPQAAVGQLDKVIELEPRDEMAVHLRKALEPLLPKPGAPVITPGVVSRD